jgi:hypothetical protein
LDGPPSHKLELIAVSAALKLDLNGSRLQVKRQRIQTERVRGQEQDLLLGHGDLRIVPL